MNRIVVKLNRVKDIGEEARRVLGEFEQSGQKLGEGEFVLNVDLSRSIAGDPCWCNCGSGSGCGGGGQGC